MKNLNLNKFKKQYNENGFVIIKKFYEKKIINSINLDLKAYLEEKTKEKSKRFINKLSNNKINSLHNIQNWSWSKKLQKEKKLRLVVKKLLEERIEDFGSELFAKPPKLGLAVPIHQDNYYWCLNKNNALTVWIAIDKSNKKNGGIYYFKKSHKLGLLEHSPSFTPGSSQKIKYPEYMQFFKKFTPTLNPGDILIHNCVVVHGSEKNKSNKPRKGLTLRFKSHSSKIDKFLRKKYEVELKSQIKKRS